LVGFLRERLQGQLVGAIFRLLLDIVGTVEIGSATLLGAAKPAHPLQIAQHVAALDCQDVIVEAGLRQTTIKQNGRAWRLLRQ